jgi:TetR/AcrR family transcriptional regulator, transcriptional repressor of bet genes
LKRASPPSEPRFERKLPEERRQALVMATIACLKRDGHDGLSIRRISAQAGVSIGLINHHFPTKDALVAEAYRYFNSELVGGLRQAVARTTGTPREQLRAFFRASFSPPNLDSEVLAVWVVFWGLYRHSRDIQRVQSETYHGYVDLLRGMLADLERESGQLRFNLRLAAIGLTALIDGLWLEWCLDPDSFEPDEAVQLCEAWVDRLEDRGTV